MNASRLLAGAVALGLLLTGCATTTVASPSPTPVVTETPTPTPTPEAPVATALVVSLEALTVVDQEGTPMRTVAFAEPDGIVAFLTELIGAEPIITDFSPKGFMNYEWDGVRVSARSASSTVGLSAAEIGGLPVSTSEGIHVGSTRADLAGIALFDDAYDRDGDGISDAFGAEAVEVPGSGTAFIGIEFTGDTVTRLVAPDSDFGDV